MSDDQPEPPHGRAARQFSKGFVDRMTDASGLQYTPPDQVVKFSEEELKLRLQQQEEERRQWLAVRTPIRLRRQRRKAAAERVSSPTVDAGEVTQFMKRRSAEEATSDQIEIEVLERFPISLDQLFELATQANLKIAQDDD